MSARTFVVTVSDAPTRVVVEDVRSRRHAVVEDLAAVGRQIAALLQAQTQSEQPVASSRPTPS